MCIDVPHWQCPLKRIMTSEHEYVTAFPKMMVQLIVETVVFIVVNLVIGQLLSKLHIDQSRGFWKVKITKIILKDLSFKCAFLTICFVRKIIDTVLFKKM